MKILYLGRFEPFWATEEYVRQALVEEGHDVKKIHLDGRQKLRGIMWHVKEFEPDFVLFSKSGAKLSWFSELIVSLKKKEVLTVAWIWDLYWGYRSKKPAQFRCEKVFTTDGGHDQKWLDQDINHEVVRQGIHAPDRVIKPGDYKHDVCFVGSAESYRGRTHLTRWLKATYGERYRHVKGVRGIELNNVLAKCKVIIGDSYPVKNYWSNRIYEVLGRGGFFMHPKTEGLDKEFKSGKHYISYDRLDRHDLKTAIDYWVDHDEEREEIRQFGFKHCGENFTYNHRIRELITAIMAVAPSESH